MNSSGSLYGVMLMILPDIPASRRIRIARSAAFTPAPSLSYARRTSFVYFLISPACPGVNAVPSDATACVNPA